MNTFRLLAVVAGLALLVGCPQEPVEGAEPDGDGVLPLAAENGGTGTIPLRVQALEDDVKIVKADMKKLLAYFDAHQNFAAAPRKAPNERKHRATHHKPKPKKCCPPQPPATTCAPPRPCPPPTTCAPRRIIIPMTTCAPPTTCAPIRRICW